MNNKIDSEKLKRAKEQLACHIRPPENSPYAKMLAESVPQAAETENSTASIGVSASCEPSDAHKIRLTEMTTAGG